MSQAGLVPLQNAAMPEGEQLATEMVDPLFGLEVDNLR